MIDQELLLSEGQETGIAAAFLWHRNKEIQKVILQVWRSHKDTQKSVND